MSKTIGKSTPYLRQDTAWHHHLSLLLLLNRSLHVCDCECYKVPWGVRLLVPKCKFICLPYALEKPLLFVAFAKLAMWETYNFQDTINVSIVFSKIHSTIFSAYMETIKAFVFSAAPPFAICTHPNLWPRIYLLCHISLTLHTAKHKSSEHTSNDTNAKARMTKVTFNASEWQ